MSSKVWALVAAAALLGACGDDDPSDPDEPDLTRADVAGEYVLTELSFDPQGPALGEADLLTRIDFAQHPELIVVADDDSLQLIFRIDGGLLRVVPGSYDLHDDGITAQLGTATEAAELLIPQQLTYLFDETEGTLRFSGSFSADTARLFELVPEWSDNPVADPLPGTLTVTFDRDADI